ncbi:TonB-dependent receptor [Sphingomonas histidinilytica]|uniref:Iron complex outermembrane recepter protein n=1 Tax=Rhizorhabdus histidinilytica TaxID=439228 RepID=A0A1T5FTC3_9SPHN|nr:TonB-dependent receptor [Rhizorhabdus histidinilytica]MBO9377031.1 TonB-dependent receptor [Rhizorhabdus histidinilytica]SKB99396.1 iron complex outermembrane recepter protein [Rhizorhabdus histidinilytica]
MRVLNKALFLTVCSVPTMAIAQVTPAAADEGGFTGVEEIVVTAQKRAENLQNVPIAVSAYSSAALEQKGATNLGALFQTPPPGVVMQPFAGSQSLLIVDMRGITNADPGQGTTELGTAVYVDDVYLGRGQGLGVELADPERIEVLRGPQGTLFGRNAEGGAIRIVTKKPTGEFGGTAKVTVGNYDQRRYEAHLNLPAIAGFAIKLDYLNSRHDGYTKNGPRDPKLARQADFAAYDAEGYRASVRWQPVDTVTIDYAYDHSKTRDTRDYNILAQPPFGFRPDGPLTPLATFGGARPLTDSIRRRTDHSWIPMYNAPFDVKTLGHSLQAEWEISDSLKLRSISAYRETRESGGGQLGGAFTLSSLGPAGQPIQALIPGLGTGTLGLPASVTRVYGISGVVAFNDVDQKQKSQEFQLIGSTDQLEYVMGLYYFNEKVRDTRQSFLSIIYTDPAFSNAIATNPFTVGSATSGLSSQRAESTSYAAFAQATWSPAFAEDRLHLTAGLRYTNDKKTFLRTMNGGAAVNLVGQPFREKRFDPAFTIAYDLADNIHSYARYAQAYRAGGVSVRSPGFKPFGAEVNKAYEIGVKSDLLDRRLRVNAALFENRIHNRQITVQLDPTGNPAVTDTLNAPGVTRIRGGELEIVAVPTNGLQTSLSYGYLKGRRPPSYRTLDPNAEVRIQSLPKHSVTAALDWAFPEADFGQFVLHVDYAMASKTPGTGRVAFGAYAFDIDRDVANARFSLQNISVGPTRLRVSAFVKNLFDTAYPVFTAPGANAILSPPRTYGLELSASF